MAEVSHDAVPGSVDSESYKILVVYVDISPSARVLTMGSVNTMNHELIDSG